MDLVQQARIAAEVVIVEQQRDVVLAAECSHHRLGRIDHVCADRAVLEQIGDGAGFSLIGADQDARCPAVVGLAGNNVP